MPSTSQPGSAPVPRRPIGRALWLMLAAALLFVMMPFLFWRATWFGGKMSDAEITRGLLGNGRARDIEHALSQAEERIRRGDPSARQWYPAIAALGENSVDQVRLTAAWVMGQDNTSPAFHSQLLRLLGDPQPMVARNAALALVRFDDKAGHKQLIAMLQPYAFDSPLTGTLRARLKPGDVVNPDMLVAKIEVDGKAQDVLEPVPGKIARWMASDGQVVVTGQPLLIVSPSEGMVWESLRALYLVGRAEDVAAVEPFIHGYQDFDGRVAQQAQATLRQISSRTVTGKGPSSHVGDTGEQAQH
jgi:biotin carboxyl carrier protein